MAEKDLSRIGLRVGNIQVLHRLGEGGMGALFVGFDEKLQRKVALKAIRSDRRLEIASRTRFLREARILSQLDDARICRIHDYLESDAGDFLVLELIEGQNLRQAIHGGHEKIAALAICEEIAGALATAHAKGVIHRDLKPDNVMLAADGRVKVLDFGLAQSAGEAYETRGSSPGATPRAEHVEIAADQGPWQDATRMLFEASSTSDTVLGTVGYMSPEQARGDRLTTASDLYSLGVLLQELLTGEPPFDRNLAPGVVLVKVAQGETRPVRGLSAELTALIQDLKAKAPAARPTALDAVARLRTLRDLPRRRMRRLAAAAAAMLLLAAGFKYTIDLRRERAAAVAARQESEQVLEFVSGLFAFAPDALQPDSELSARDLLERASLRLRTELQDQPLARARLLEQIATLNRNLGLYEPSLTFGREALSLRENALPPDDPLIAESLERLGGVYWNLSRNSEAEPLLLRCLKIRERRFGKDSIEVGDTLNFVANLYADTRRLAEAEELYRQALALRRRYRGERSEAVASTLSNLANVLVDKNDAAGAEKLYLESIAIKKAATEVDHISLGRVYNNLARLYNKERRFADAEKLANVAIGLWENKLGNEHPLVAWGLNNLANIYRDQGRFAEAEPLYVRTLQIRRKALTSRNALVLKTEQDYAQSLEAAGRADEAQAVRAGLAAGG
jgi:serine/threonine protein kinase